MTNHSVQYFVVSESDDESEKEVKEAKETESPAVAPPDKIELKIDDIANPLSPKGPGEEVSNLKLHGLMISKYFKAKYIN